MKTSIKNIFKPVLDGEKDNGKRSLFTGNLYSVHEFDTMPQDLQAIIDKLGRKKKINLERLKNLALFLSNFAIVDEGGEKVREICLSSKFRKLQSLFGSQQNACNAMQLALNTGLLICTKESFDFVTHDCKGYIVNPSLLSALMETNTGEQVQAPVIVQRFKAGEIRFSHAMRKAASKEEIMQGLFESYPFLTDYASKIEMLNNTLYHEKHEKLFFAPKITKSKGGFITSTAIRYYSQICLLNKKEERPAYLQARFAGKPVYSFDIKNSIFRVAYFLKNKIWLNNNIDLLPLMFKKDFASKEERNEYKRIAMRLYFGGSPLNVYNQQMRRFTNEKNKRDILETIERAQANMFGVVGAPLSNEIFFIESCIYIDLLCALAARGVNVVSVYDCFFSDESTLEIQIKSLLPVIAREFVEKYGKHFERVETATAACEESTAEKSAMIDEFANDIEESAQNAIETLCFPFWCSESETFLQELLEAI